MPRGNPNFGKKQPLQTQEEDSDVLTENTTEITVQDPESVVETKQEQQEVVQMVPLSEVQRMIDAALGSKKESQPQTIIHSVQPTGVNEVVDTLPELKGWIVEDKQYEMVDKSRPESVGIRIRHQKLSPLTYINPDTNKSYALRLCSNHPSFLVEDQKGTEHILQRVIFKAGRLMLPKTMQKEQKFLHIHPDNGKLFREVNLNIEAKKEVDLIELKADALIKARQLEYTEQASIAMIMDKSFEESWTPSMVKQSLYAKLSDNPQLFMNLASDQSVPYQRIGKLAVKRGILTFRDFNFHDAKDDSLIHATQKGTDEFKSIALFWMTGTGRSTYNYYKRLVDGERD